MSADELPAREAMEFDVVIVGAGPAGLAAAIRLKQISPDISVVVVEKGSEVGAHILSAARALRLPNLMMPPLMSNHGNYVVSLGNVCRWLATKAEGLGVEIYPGFAAAEVLYGAQGEVVGVA